MPPIGPPSATASSATGWVYSDFPAPPTSPPPRPDRPAHPEAAALLGGRYGIDMSSAASSESSEGTNSWCQSLREFCSATGDALYRSCNAFSTKQVTMGAATVAAGGVMLAAGGMIGGIVATAAAGAAVRAVGGSSAFSGTSSPLDMFTGMSNQRPNPPVQSKMAFWSQVEGRVKFEALDFSTKTDSSVEMPGKGMAMIKTDGKIGFVRASAEGAGEDATWIGNSGGCYVAFKQQTGGGKSRIQIERQKGVSAERCMDEAIAPLLSHRDITIRGVNRNGHGDMSMECWDASGKSVGSGTGDSVEIKTAAANGPFSCKTKNLENETDFVWMNKIDARSVTKDVNNDPFACLVNSRDFALSEVKSCISKSDCQPADRTTPAPTTTQSDATQSNAAYTATAQSDTTTSDASHTATQSSETSSASPMSAQSASDATQENTSAN